MKAVLEEGQVSEEVEIEGLALDIPCFLHFVWSIDLEIPWEVIKKHKPPHI